MAVFTVTSLLDTGAGSLRQAIEEANNTDGKDTIEFQAGLTGRITLASGELDINDDLTINGLGANLITIDANDTPESLILTRPMKSISVVLPLQAD